MFKGTPILESLREDVSLSRFRFVVSAVGRGRPQLSAQQVAAGFPRVWSSIEFELDEASGAELARTLSDVLERGWYANFSSSAETFAVYPGRDFRYPRDDLVRRAEAQAFGQTLGIPDRQLVWTE